MQKMHIIHSKMPCHHQVAVR